MSGFLGQILGGMMGGGQGAPTAGQPTALVAVLRQVLVSNGGIDQLVSRFDAAGLGGQARSWVGSGQNQPVSPEQIGQVFSDDQLAQWATQAGTTPDQLRTVLAEALPHAVDHATPGGEMPAADAMPDLAGLVGQLLGQGRQNRA